MKRRRKRKPPIVIIELICLNCGDTMWEQGCKLRCPRCHYHVSCSDLL